MTTRAHSIDGSRFSFEVPMAAPLPIGTYVQISTSGGRTYLGQVLESTVVATSHSEAAEGHGRAIEGLGVLLAQLTVDGSAPVTVADVFGSATVAEADSADVAAHFARWTVDAAGLNLGSLTTIDGVPAVLAAPGFARHTFLCGQSGSGKTYTLGLVLEQLLLETDICIAVLDPNSDYVNIGSLQERSKTGLGAREYEDLTARYESIAPGVFVFGGADSPMRLQARFGRLSLEQQTMVLGLDPIRDPEEYNAFIEVVTGIDDEDYTLEDVLDRLRTTFGESERKLGMRIMNLGVADLSVWAGRGERAIREVIPPDWRMAVFDLGSLPSDRERSIAAAAVLGSMWEERAERRPVLIVVDEAHNVCPQVPIDANQALATEQAIKIAGEGRKYGKYLLLATQRPQKVHQNVLSQCDNLVLMRMNSAADIEQIQQSFSFAPAALVEQAPGFGLGEGLAAGKISPDPIRFQTGRRYTAEGGADVPASWSRRR
jgi:DNA helicase HerA-like ATPase